MSIPEKIGIRATADLLARRREGAQAQYNRGPTSRLARRLARAQAAPSAALLRRPRTAIAIAPSLSHQHAPRGVDLHVPGAHAVCVHKRVPA